MYKIIAPLILFVFVALFFTACENASTTPTPEVEVISFNPLGMYSFPGDTTPVGMDTVTFKVWNYVDCRIRHISYVYYGVKSGNTVTSTYEIDLDVYLKGGNQDTVGSNITHVYNLWLETDEALDYMYSNDDNTVAEITFSGEDDYGKGKTFTCNKIYYALIKTPTSGKKIKILPVSIGGE